MGSLIDLHSFVQNTEVISSNSIPNQDRQKLQAKKASPLPFDAYLLQSH